ncbi:uncharacterized protein Dana_GF19609 [Drosophila ananassae]|uniref:Uncharacterized protein n=1 Tax=Drosophila ananassae TaxID=7217 RepID=B3N1U7_DROAN|nr:uncharacterized protein LOC6502362 [Drosophila ananassae]EDV29988.1 uncharacterized protein Dana_GF19609 [Drosophila ananassae]
MFQMFDINVLNRRLFRILRRLISGRDDFGPYSIWNFCPMNRWNQARALVFSCSPCRSEWFPYLFWTVVVSSFIGCIISLWELRRVWKCPCQKLNMWRNRHFYIINHRLLRQARVCGSGISSFLWFLLILGITLITPLFMWPWIFMTTIVLSVEWFIWGFEILTGRQNIEFHTLISLTLPVFNLGMVLCVKRVFDAAVSDDSDFSLRIF